MPEFVERNQDTEADDHPPDRCEEITHKILY